ncbi:MAG: CBS domain-containing protein [Candidatus Bathyarchaeia archaeon]
MWNLSSGASLFKVLKKIGLMDRPLYAKEFMTPWTMIGRKQSEDERYITITTRYGDQQREYVLALDRNGKIIGAMTKVKSNDTLFDVASKMKSSNADVAEVVDESDKPLGIITKADVQTLARA